MKDWVHFLTEELHTECFAYKMCQAFPESAIAAAFSLSDHNEAERTLTSELY